MVKNNTGGNKAKGFARKNIVKKDTTLRVPHEEGEIYAQAVKVMGGSIASVIDIEGNPLRAHIRGKFRGRGKRDNFITAGTWLLVGLHDWQTKPGDKTSNLRDCDILEVYTENDKNRLKNSVTTVDWCRFIANDTKTFSSEVEKGETEIEFSDEATQEYEQLIAAQLSAGNTNTIITDDGEQIDVEDI